MYIHLGNNNILKTEDIIGIFDLDNTTVCARTRNFLKKAEKEKRVVLTGSELPKSFTVTGDNKVYLSFLAPSTLLKRSFNFINNIKEIKK